MAGVSAEKKRRTRVGIIGTVYIYTRGIDPRTSFSLYIYSHGAADNFALMRPARTRAKAQGNSARILARAFICEIAQLHA